MKITVKIADIEVIVDRPNFMDYDSMKSPDGTEIRPNIVADTVLPTLKEAVEKAKELYNIKNDSRV